MAEGTDVRRFEGDEEPPTLRHLLFHLAKDVGLLAAALEKEDHEAEEAEGELQVERWLARGLPRMRKTLDRLEERARKERRWEWPPVDERRRAPSVEVVLHLWPQPPRGASPHWWGLHDLTFYDKDAGPVWHRQFPEVEGTSYAAEVFEHRTFGWCIRLTFTHDKAAPALAALGLRNPPGEEPNAAPKEVPTDG